MHVHSLGDEHVSPPLYLANGLTTVREMAAPDPVVYDWRDRINAGTLLGPRMVVASQIIDGDPTLWDPNLLHVLVVNDEASARAAVRQVKAEGADFVKVYSRLGPTAYRAILDEARRNGLTVHGHGPDQVSVQQVSNAGQRSIEHIHALALSVSSREAEVRRMQRAITIRTGDYNGWFRQVHPIEWIAANSFSRSRAADVFGLLRRNRTRVTPTLTMHNVLDRPDYTSLDPATGKYLSADSIGTYEYVLANLYSANRPPRRSPGSSRCGTTASGSSANCSPMTSRSWPARTPVRRGWCPGSPCTRSSNCWSAPEPLRARPCTPRPSSRPGSSG